MGERLAELTHWLRDEVGLPAFDIAPASSDASFRRYFRASAGTESWIAMDAPPDKEDVRPFMRIAGLLSEIGLNVPVVLESDLARGFLLLTDLGDRQYLGELSEHSVERLYGDALTALAGLQARGPRQPGSLPEYGRPLLRAEMELFREWYLGRHLGLSPDAAQQRELDEAFALLAASALEQPQVCVHRDFHSRNLMVHHHNPGILDFQDAVIGPVTYDLVSLLRDCYVAWPRARVEEWALGYLDLAVQSGVVEDRDEQRFLRWFDLMGVQRHLKAIGIFARLNIRDGKPGYLQDIPRTLAYVVEVAGRHPELNAFSRVLADLLGAERDGSAAGS